MPEYPEYLLSCSNGLSMSATFLTLKRVVGLVPVAAQFCVAVVTVAPLSPPL